jgi:hypothetical protein
MLQKAQIAGNSTLRRRLETPLRLLTSFEHRTFGGHLLGEKAAALHAEPPRPKESPAPQYFRRHYYDIPMLLDTEDGKGGRHRLRTS